MNIHNRFFTKKTLEDVLSGANARVLPVCTRIYPYVTGLFLVCTRMYPYVTCMYSYVLVWCSSHDRILTCDYSERSVLQFLYFCC